MIAMWVIWFLAIYGLSTILIDLMKHWNQYYHQVREVNIHLLVFNSETRLEDTIRSLSSLSQLEGRPIHLTVYDFGSTDHTAQMIDYLQRYNPYLIEKISILDQNQVQEDLQKAVTTIDLRQGLGPRDSSGAVVV
ncbi:MAG TPA: hypothetical protein VJ824_16345 [Bacillota bacterium]|nr:hypothetical protein [Bacillota bacterium]